MSQPFLELRGLGKRFGTVEVLSDLHLALVEGEILALLGLSGSGKTTALRLVAGFETPDAGQVMVDGEDVTGVQPSKRGFGMVFQHYALFPHMSVAANIAFGLGAHGWPKSRIEDRVRSMLRLVDLDGFGPRRVDAVSGGQQQRVALARALAPEPRVLLLDEPLSNLDPALRLRTRRELRDAIKATGITTLLVTHEQEEAFDVGDRVAVLDRGRLAQVGQPEELYRTPTDRFVATFVGRSSSFAGTARKIGDRIGVEVADGVVWTGRAAEEVPAGKQAELIVRPESLRLVGDDEPAAVRGAVESVQFTGPLSFAAVRLDSGAEAELVVDLESLGPGDRVALAIDPSGPEAAIFRAQADP